jgi:hypothetical protein
MNNEMRYASDIYDAVGSLKLQLAQLAGEGRITMSTDGWNDKWPDVNAAVKAALEGLEQAQQALAWMVTETDADGEYPVLKD